MGAVIYDREIIIKIVIFLFIAVIGVLLYNYWTTGKFFFTPPVEEKTETKPQEKKDMEFFKNISKPNNKKMENNECRYEEKILDQKMKDESKEELNTQLKEEINTQLKEELIQGPKIEEIPELETNSEEIQIF